MMTQAEYDAKRDARYERLVASANRAAQQSEQAWNASNKIASVIPLGQPIMVGHYSEKRHRRAIAQIQSKARKGYELYKQSQELKSRADAASNNGAIYSDDPSAVEKLEAEIAEKELEVNRMKAINKWIRTKDERYLEIHGLDVASANEMLEKSLYRSDGCFPAYALSNRNANIRRLKQRVEAVKKRQAIQASSETINGVLIEQNPDVMRTQIKFNGKPPQSIIDMLKSSGFKWSPTEERWQRLIGNGALYEARQIAQKYGEVK